MEKSGITRGEKESPIFESEDSVYPVSEGFQGKSMLLKAIIDVYSGLPIERVLEVYRLNRKGRKTVVIEKLHEILG